MTSDWRETARQMRLDGKFPTEIARLLGIGRGRVRNALEIRVRPKRESRRIRPRKSADQPAIGKHAYIPTERGSAEVRLPRKIRKVIADPATILAAARAFSDANSRRAGSMPVAAFMKMITVGERA